MKKFFIMLMFLLCIAGTSFAQTTTERQDAVGKFRFIPSVMISYNPYSLTDSHYQDVSPKYTIGLGAGMEVEYRFHEGLGVALGVNYLVQGIKTSKKENTGSVIILGPYNKTKEQEEKLKSLIVPLLICMHPLQNDRLTLKVGCQAEFLLGMGDKYKKTSLGAPLAIAYNFSDRLQFELHYNYGLTDILKEDEISVSRNCLLLSVGVRL